MNQKITANVNQDQIASLIADLGSPDGSTRQQARKQLIADGDLVVPALIEVLSDRNDHMRWEAAKALGKLHAPSAAEGLVALLEDQNVDVRWASAESLVLLRKDAVAPVLVRLVKNFDSVWLREGSRYVLRQLKKRGFLDQPVVTVLKALDGPAPEVQVPWAAKAALDAMQVDWDHETRPKVNSAVKEIDLPMGAQVICPDGVGGKITCVIINPVDEKVTHLVIEKQSFPSIEVLVPLEQVISSTPTSVHLLCNTAELDTMKHFIETEFLPNTVYNTGSAPSMLWPYDAPGLGVIVLEKERIPADEMAVHRGSHVYATDGEVGRVDEFLIDPDSGAITHLILREGHPWNRAEVTIPVSQIDHIEEDEVYLYLDKGAIEALPSIPLRHRQLAH